MRGGKPFSLGLGGLQRDPDARNKALNPKTLPLPIHHRVTCIIWVVVKIMVPFWIPIIIRHLIFGVPKKGLIGYT